MPLDTALLGKYARLYLARKALKDKYNELTTKLIAMEQPLIDHMKDQGDDAVERLSLKGGRTLSISSQIWAKILVEDKLEVVKALRTIDKEHLISGETVNHQSLSAWLRELDNEGKDLPIELNGLVEPNPVEKLIAKKY